MNNCLPFFNWSLKRTLETEPDSFTRARIRIIYTILLFSLVKALVVIGIGSAHEQWLQVVRAAVAFVIYTALGKVLLWRPERMSRLAHIMIIAGVLIIWTNIFVYSHKINMVTLQFVFMIALSSFYTLGSRAGFIYSAVSILPILLFLAFKGSADIYFPGATQEFASPGFEIIVVLNFISIIVSHYLFYEAFRVNNRELQTSMADATKMAESRSNFLSTMSHELRTPLNSVIGITELLLDDKPEERQKDNLKILQSSSLDLLSLINNILDFNKIDSDRLTLEPVSFGLAEFMQNICAVLRVKARDKKLDFVLDIAKDLKTAYIVSDPTRLSQLIYNLVSNAIKFTEKGSVTVKLECVRNEAGEIAVLFSVTDTGIGIHPDRHEAIFELFTQAETHTTRKYGGTGLGLAIVKQVLVLFNSAIGLESNIGQGTRFFFTILFATAAAGSSNEDAPASHADLGHLRILVAEDNDVNRLLMQKQLGKLNITPVMAQDGVAAYEAYRAGAFDAIFMDLHMPEQNGYETTTRIRAMADGDKNGVYIVAFTASVTEQQKIYSAGFDDYLYKPVKMNDLRNKLEQIAERKGVGV